MLLSIFSLSTNFSDAGEHSNSKHGDIRFQSTLLYGYRLFQTLPFEELLKYDAHGCSLNLFDKLGVSREDTCIDLYGNRNNKYNKRFYLSVESKPYLVIKSFGLCMRPMEMNIIKDIPGNDIFLYDTTIAAKKPKHSGLTKRVMYYQKGFNSLLLWQLIKGNVSFLLMKATDRLKKGFK